MTVSKKRDLLVALKGGVARENMKSQHYKQRRERT
jgi:hypothetical protein